jgi:hypothetical protein
MRCEDLTRELASPTGHLSQAEMAGHLADCPSCAEWSRRAAHLDQIWEATRPAEPSEATLDVLWASASAALDARTVPATLRLEGLTHGRRSWVKPAFMVAQAAAMLAAAVFLFQQGGHERVQIAIVEPAKPQFKLIKVETAKVVMPLDVLVEVGETAVVKIGDDNSHQVVFQKESAPDPSSVPKLSTFDVSRGVEEMEPILLGSVDSR